jgi:hypothetical protein
MQDSMPLFLAEATNGTMITDWRQVPGAVCIFEGGEEGVEREKGEKGEEGKREDKRGERGGEKS